MAPAAQPWHDGQQGDGDTMGGSELQQYTQQCDSNTSSNGKSLFFFFSCLRFCLAPHTIIATLNITACDERHDEQCHDGTISSKHCSDAIFDSDTTRRDM